MLTCHELGHAEGLDHTNDSSDCIGTNSSGSQLSLATLTLGHESKNDLAGLIYCGHSDGSGAPPCDCVSAPCPQAIGATTTSPTTTNSAASMFPILGTVVTKSTSIGGVVRVDETITTLLDGGIIWTHYDYASIHRQR